LEEEVVLNAFQEPPGLLEIEIKY